MAINVTQAELRELQARTGHVVKRADAWGAARAVRLPWPPSVNTYWRSVNGRVLISRTGREYRAAVSRIDLPRFGAARLAVTIDAYPPDKRRRDLDNLPKSVLDAMQHAGAFDDDSQIDRLTIERHAPCEGGYLSVTLDEKR